MIVPLRELHIENFRGVRQAKIRLDPKVTVLFGANAAGKTTLLDALAIGLGAISARVPRAKGRGFASRGDLRIEGWQRTILEVLGAEPALHPREPGPEARFARISLQSDGCNWDVTKFRSPQDRDSVPRGKGVKSLNEWLDPRIREALDTPGRPTPAIPLVAAYGNERAVVDVPLREKFFNRDFDRFGGLDGALQATTRFKTVFEWFRVMEDEERRGKESHQDFGYRLPALQWVRRAVRAAELRCRNPRVETGPIRMLVDFEQDDHLQSLDIRALSDGFRTHFSLVVDLARRMVQLNPSDDLDDPERGTNSPAIVLIDEVDLHLDPRWQARVVRGLCMAFPNTQFVLTTHSEQVIGSVDAAQVRRLRWHDGEIVAEEVPFAQGATAERILIELMDASERVPGAVTEKLERYLALVTNGDGRGPEAVGLREHLAMVLRDDPALHRADLEMQRQALMAKVRGTEA